MAYTQVAAVTQNAEYYPAFISIRRFEQGVQILVRTKDAQIPSEIILAEHEWVRLLQEIDKDRS